MLGLELFLLLWSPVTKHNICLVFKFRTAPNSALVELMFNYVNACHPSLCLIIDIRMVSLFCVLWLSANNILP